MSSVVSVAQQIRDSAVREGATNERVRVLKLLVEHADTVMKNNPNNETARVLAKVLLDEAKIIETGLSFQQALTKVYPSSSNSP